MHIRRCNQVSPVNRYHTRPSLPTKMHVAVALWVFLEEIPHLVVIEEYSHVREKKIKILKFFRPHSALRTMCTRTFTRRRIASLNLSPLIELRNKPNSSLAHELELTEISHWCRHPYCPPVTLHFQLSD